jgi:hypothetical protein
MQGQQEAIAHKTGDLCRLELTAGLIELVQHQKKMALVVLELGTLAGSAGVLNRQAMEPELLLHDPGVRVVDRRNVGLSPHDVAELRA